VKKPLFTHTHCTVNDNSKPQCFVFFPFSLCFWICVMIVFLNFFYRFYLLILRWLRIWLHNLFLFILPFYKVSMVCEFAMVTLVALIYEFGGVSFFLIELKFFYRLFSSHIVKKQISEKSYVIKLYKVCGSIHRFGWLTWFAGLASLTFLN